MPRKPTDKGSYSSVKLPPIGRYARSHHSSKNNINLNDISLKAINTRDSNAGRLSSALRPSSLNPKTKGYIIPKSKSRAEPARIKTEGVASANQECNPEGEGSFTKIDDTLADFKKYVEKNKEQIHQEIHKRNNIVKRSERNIGQYHDKTQRCRNKFANRRMAESENNIFGEIEKILNRCDETSSTIDLDKVEHTVKFVSLANNLRKLSPKVKQNIKSEMESSIIRKFDLKNEKNYHQWRRVKLDPNEHTIGYSQSNFEIQKQRLDHLALKTEASIQKYIQNKQHLLLLRSKSQKNQD